MEIGSRVYITCLHFTRIGLAPALPSQLFHVIYFSFFFLQYSLGEYMSAFKQDPSNPMVALMLGLTFTHLACQKFSAKKHSLVVQVRTYVRTRTKWRVNDHSRSYAKEIENVVEVVDTITRLLPPDSL